MCQDDKPVIGDRWKIKVETEIDSDNRPQSVFDQPHEGHRVEVGQHSILWQSLERISEIWDENDQRETHQEYTHGGIEIEWPDNRRYVRHGFDVEPQTNEDRDQIEREQYNEAWSVFEVISGISLRNHIDSPHRVPIGTSLRLWHVPFESDGLAVRHKFFGKSLYPPLAEMSTRLMFEPFSDGYYLGRLYVEPHDGDTAAINRTQHKEVNRELYTTGEGIERLDHPLVMKLDCRHYAVHSDATVPEETLVVPESTVDAQELHRLPGTREVLLAKADRAAQLLDLFTFPRSGTGI